MDPSSLLETANMAETTAITVIYRNGSPAVLQQSCCTEYMAVEYT